MTSTSARRILTLASLVLLGASATRAQTPADSIILKAGTQIVVSNRKEINPKKAALGDSVDFRIDRSVFVSNRRVIKARADLRGHITALKPKLEVTLDPIYPAEVSVAFAGHPFERKPAKHGNPPPSELDYHFKTTGKEKVQSAADIAAASAIVAPILVIGSPLIVAILISEHGKLHANTQSVVTTATDVSFPADAFPPERYVGLPVIYVEDRWRAKDNSISCGTDPFHANAFIQNLNIRVAPGSYTFHTSDPAQSAATVDAQQNGLYLVYRDQVGLHSIDLATRVDLLDALQPPNQLRNFFRDQSEDTPEALAAHEQSRQNGGCGLEPALHMRPRPSSP